MGRLTSTKKILVVGGAGFIGSHLCEKLLGDKHTVFCLDNLVTGFEKNIKHLLANPNFKFYNGNAVNTGELEFACNYKTCDEIYYLASVASPLKYIEHPFETIDANVWGLRNALEVADEWGARILYTSTSEVYGNPEEYPQTEEYNGNVDPTTDRAVYDESKRLGETLCFLHKRAKGTDVVTVRIFNTYGPRMSLEDGRVVPSFIKCALKGEPATIYGDGLQSRSFCYIDDMINGLISAMRVGDAGPINLGNPNENYSIGELHEIINEIMNVDTPPTFAEFPTENDPVDRCPDIRFARKILKWKPLINIYDGLNKTVEFIKNDQLDSNTQQ